ncbi:winged helix-turn-helix domain-containing protein [Micromonospora sp. WMMD1120]|uniref:winged helix-turn-helix domain-containing protein n=1 Tax=Micromonospora sp. WMMD1120 TaxID=3016106 RepID=UPI002417885D|nr:winged helix-turn-helix domain-containing protein [Micromonospora sp. WMMD1120]MDG4806452.1 winged helix-turn-helix domain-containing protein [Micromonospora sp. WMMD1120]
MERVLKQLGGVGRVVRSADPYQLRTLLFPSPDAPTRAGPAVVPLVVPTGPVSCGDLVVDRAGHLVTWRGSPLPLSPTEREVLARLVGPPRVVWSHEQLRTAILQGADPKGLQSTIDRLRHKLRDLPGGPRMRAVHGVGYRLDPPSN